MTEQLRIVILEDEPATARNLSNLLKLANADITIAAVLTTVSDGADWFRTNPNAYDLIFMDIRLADGISFDIFKRCAIHKPVIFVTAYNDYATQAFKNNGIDYILKPFNEADILGALAKYNKLLASSQAYTGNIQHLIDLIQTPPPSYKRSFLIHYREKLIPVETAKVAWFYTTHEVVYLRTLDDREFVMDFTMEQLEHQVDPQQFFRANRQFILNRHIITEIDFYFNGRLLVMVKPEPPERILVSKARATEFRNWMNG